MAMSIYALMTSSIDRSNRFFAKAFGDRFAVVQELIPLVNRPYSLVYNDVSLLSRALTPIFNTGFRRLSWRCNVFRENLACCSVFLAGVS